MNASILDIVCQIVIAVGGLTALLLVERGNRWGFMVGLLQQPFWFYATLHGRQWGLFALSLAYAVVWARGVKRRFGKAAVPAAAL